MRRGASTLLVAVGLLTIPPNAEAAAVTYAGHVAGDPSTAIRITVSGSWSEKGRFEARKVRRFEATVDYNCFDAAGSLVSTSKRSDLPFGLLVPAQVRPNGGFYGAVIRDGGVSRYVIKGRLRKGKASGELAAGQFPTLQPNGPHCSTGTFSNFTVQWAAKLRPSKMLPGR